MKRRQPPKIPTALLQAARAAEQQGSMSNFVSVGGGLHPRSAAAATAAAQHSPAAAAPRADHRAPVVDDDSGDFRFIARDGRWELRQQEQQQQQPGAAAAAGVDGDADAGAADADGDDGDASDASGAGEGGLQLAGLAEVPTLPCAATATLLFAARVRAPAAGDGGPQCRAAVSLTAVLDRSGSMSGTPMRLQQDALAFVASELLPGDSLGVVAPLRPLTPRHRAAVVAAVRGLTAVGGMDLCGGLLRGIAQQRVEPPRAVGRCARAALLSLSRAALPLELLRGVFGCIVALPPAPGVVQSVWLLTDGHANRGVADAAQICAEATRRVAARGPVLHTFGFGASHNEQLLRSVAERGQGQYAFIPSADRIAPTLADTLG
eukprot:gene1389-5050_t